MKFIPKTTDLALSPYTGLTRTFFIATPLIHDNPDLKICRLAMTVYDSWDELDYVLISQTITKECEPLFV